MLSARLAIPLLAFVFISCSAADARRSAAERDSAGIRIIENVDAAWSTGEEWPVT